MYYFFIVLIASLVPAQSFALNQYEACDKIAAFDNGGCDAHGSDSSCRIQQGFPRENNVCYILLDSPTIKLNNNDTYETTLAKDFVLDIQGGDRIKVLQIIANRKTVAITAGKTDTITFSQDTPRIRPGKNIITIRGYVDRKTVIYKNFILTIPDTLQKPIKAQPITAFDEKRKRQTPIPYPSFIKTSFTNPARTVFQLGFVPNIQGEQILDLNNGSILSYNQYFSGDYRAGNISLTQPTGKKTNQKDVYLGYTEFNTDQYIVQYTDNTMILVGSSGHEGEAPEFLYLPSTNKRYNIRKDIVEPTLGKDAYALYSVKIRDNTLVIEEYPYCCDNIPNPGGEETITFSLKDFHVISRKKLQK